MQIEQATYGQDAGALRLLARSPGFLDEWLPEAERLCAGFGEQRPAGAACPLAVFALPFGPKHVAVVQAADQSGAMAFRLLVMSQKLYASLAGDPFWVSDQYPPNWSARDTLEAITPTAGPPPRTVADLSKVLDVEEERTQMLLGGVQILVDGGRLVFERDRPDERIARDLWALMPTSARLATWPASFAFANTHRFHLLCTPRVDPAELEGYTPEKKAGDYPEGGYELALQQAVESGDQAALDRLLARRSRAQMMRLALVLVAGFALVALFLNYPFGNKDADEAEKKAKADELRLPPVEDVPSLDPAERKALSAGLTRIGKQVGMDPPAGDAEAELADALVALDRALDEKLGEKRPRRDPGPLGKLGPARRRLQALLWKHGVADYNQRGVSADELLERLEKALAKRGVIQEGGP